MNQHFRPQLDRSLAAGILAALLSTGALAQGAGSATHAYPTAVQSAPQMQSSTHSAPAAAGQGFRYPEAGVAPSSALRIREIPQAPAPGAAPAMAVTDTPSSLALYRQCQQDADRAATDIADMQGRIAACLAELNQRRAQGQ